MLSQRTRDLLLGLLLSGGLGLGVASDLSTDLLTGRTGVDLGELGSIELWCLEDLDLADVDVLERVDALTGLHDILTDELRNELLDSLHELTAGDLLGHDVSHLLADGTNLSGLSVGSLADLEWTLLGETNAETPEDVSVNSLHVNRGLDERLPLADKGAELVGGEVHAPEVAKDLLALDLLNAELNLAVGIVLVLVEVTEGHLEHTTLKGVAGELCTREKGRLGRRESFCNARIRIEGEMPVCYDQWSLMVALEKNWVWVGQSGFRAPAARV